MNDKKRFLLLALAAVVCLAFFPACSSDSDSGSDPNSPVGTWEDDLGDPLVLNSDGTFNLWYGDWTGTYEVVGSTVTLTASDGDVFVLTFTGSTLEGVSYNTETFPFVFTRR